MDDDVMSNAAYYRSREEAERASAIQAPTDDIRQMTYNWLGATRNSPPSSNRSDDTTPKGHPFLWPHLLRPSL